MDCSFNIDSFPEIREVQMVELDILNKFADICEANGLRYFLDSGTLLGAVRHKGFIPWDDDIDVGMPREDYDKFLEIAEGLLGDQYFVQTRETDKNAPFSFGKVRKTDTLFVEWNKRNIDMHHGIYIDIFPYDVMPLEGKAEYVKECRKLNKLFYLKMIPDRSCQPQKSLKWLVAAAGKRVVYYLLKLVSTKSLDKKMEETFTRYKGKTTDVYSWPTGEEVSYRCHSFFEDVEFPASMLFPPSKVTFEGREFNGPHDIDGFLKTFYNDYMQLPPYEQRFGHRPCKVLTKKEKL